MAYTSYESFYEGTATPLSPAYGDYFSGYRFENFSNVGFPGSPTTANQLGEAVNALKQGVKAFEVSLLGVQEADQTMPKQHFAELRALMKLSGVKPSVHGPIVDAAGFTERGWGGDIVRADNERRMFDAIEKAHILDSSGKIPVVLHSTNGIPGREYIPDGEGGAKVQKVTAINLETNQITSQFEEERKFYPRYPEHFEEGGTLHTVEEQINSANLAEWENKLTDLATYAKHSDEIIQKNILNLGEYHNAVILPDREKGRKIVEVDKKGAIVKELPGFSDEQEYAYNKLREADIFLENVKLGFSTAFHKAYKYGSEEQKEELDKIAKGYAEGMKGLGEVRFDSEGKAAKIPQVWNPVKKREILEKAINQLQDVAEKYGAPKLYKDVEDFAMGEATKTFGNLAVKSYKNFGEEAPIIAIENLYQGMAFSRAEDLKKIVDGTRKQFKEYLIEEKGFKEKDAENLAKEKIGVTWDVGHLNVMKKKGFKDEDIIKETGVISEDKSMVKHVHLTDNFGFSDSHLPPGMGNVPIRGILEQLEKTGRLDEMRKIVEAGNFVQHFKSSPHPWTLAAFNSPIYGMKEGYSWNQAMGGVGAYFGGYGTVNPAGHHSLYGAGFTTLPVELGGNMPGNGAGQSRFGGTPMA